MAQFYEAAFKQLLMGVSQQDPKDRLEGQLTAQVNMTSDLVYGLRRRSPAKYVGLLEYDWTYDEVAVYSTLLGGTLLFLAVSVADGVVHAVNTSGEEVWTLQNDYLIASSKAAIRFATVGDAIFIANVEQVPTEVEDAEAAAFPDPDYYGYWYGVSTAFSKTFTVTITNRDTGVASTFSYTTPDGSTASEVNQAALEYVAEQLKASITASLTTLQVDQTGGYLSIYSPDYKISITTNSGSTYAKASKTHQAALVDDLPAYLADTHDGFIMTIGTGDDATYYRWSADDIAWYEDAEYGAGMRPTNMPVRLRLNDDSSAWELTAPEYIRRSSGNTTSNPSLAFLNGGGITGMGAFQGRLVLLAQEYVCMSDTTNPLRWYRSTTESVVASDCIEAAGSDAKGGSYTHCEVFNKDLVCFGSNVQAVIPGNNAITPSNVVVAVMSRYRFTLYAKPISTGRSMYASASRGDGYCGLWEILPSDYVDSQIVANDVTNHLPSYCAGFVHSMSASPTSGILVSAYTGELNTLLVQEYSWNGNEKRQAAWHKWVLPSDIVHAEFDSDTLYVFLNNNGGVVLASIDLRIGTGSTSTQVPRLDLYQSVTATVAEQLSVDAALWARVSDDPLVFKTSGDNPYLSQTVSVISAGTDEVVLKVVGAAVGDVYVLGRRYTSEFTLPPPLIRDGNDVPVRMHKSTLQRYHINWDYTGTFTYTFSDKYRTQPSLEITPLTFASPELAPGEPLVASGRTILPCRLDMPTVSAQFSTTDVYDLNPITVEYGYRFGNLRGKRV